MLSIVFINIYNHALFLLFLQHTSDLSFPRVLARLCTLHTGFAVTLLLSHTNIELFIFIHCLWEDRHLATLLPNFIVNLRVWLML